MNQRRFGFSQLGMGTFAIRTQNVRPTLCTERACNRVKMPPASFEYIMQNHDSLSPRKNCKAIDSECETISEMLALWGYITFLGDSKLSVFATKARRKMSNI